MRSQDAAVANLRPLGTGLHRPESVLCTADGSVWTSDWRGGVTRIEPDGTQTAFLCSDASLGLRPNGIALLPDRSFLLANLGQGGGVWRLLRDGTARPFLLTVGDQTLPPSNFVLIDRQMRTWISVSTRHQPRHLAYRPDVADGFIVLVDDAGARVVAEGLGYTNEMQVDAAGETLLVNETFGRRLTRFRIGAGGSLSRGEIVAEFGSGTYPDGLCCDSANGIWITSPVSNRIIRVDRGGEQSAFFEDADRDHVAWVEQAFQSGTMGPPHLEKGGKTRLRNLSSLAFGGPDLRTAYLGSLQGTSVETMRLPVAGAEPVHWTWM
ncbi:MAG TPA: SMP-30/gluconolactonase/LRE family protein [Thermoanaerobaculia bacterium]|nr:SMP-30/gluconolactonase/LRE family protein [Thermoanaerobaculia bacterium]